MKSIYYKFEGNTENMQPLTIANPYKHLTIFNRSDYDIYVYNDNTILAFIPANAEVTLLDVFKRNEFYFDFQITHSLYFKTESNQNANLIIHINNYGE